MTARPRGHCRSSGSRASVRDRPAFRGSIGPRRAADGCVVGCAAGGAPDRRRLLRRARVGAVGGRDAAGRVDRRPRSSPAPSISSRTTWSRAAAAGAASSASTPMHLSAGDIIVFPHGDAHVMSSAPGMRGTPDLTLYRPPSDGQLPFTISMGDSQRAESAHLVCGFLGCDARPFNPLLAALPRVIRVSDRAGGAIGAFVQFAVAESKEPRPRRRVRARPPERADVRRRRAPISGDAAGRPHGLARGTARSVRRARAHGAASKPRPRLDARVAGARGGTLALGARGALHAVRRAAADAVPGRAGACSSPRTIC